MTSVLNSINSMTADELSRSPRICIGDSEFDELERELGIGPQRRSAVGDRRLKHKGVLVFTHHANRR